MEKYAYLIVSDKPLREELLRDVLMEEVATGVITELVGVKEPAVTNIRIENL